MKEKIIREYTFDRIYTEASFAGSNEILMEDTTKGNIFNSDINVDKWKSQPQIGDKIKYIGTQEYKYPFVVNEIYINDKLVWDRARDFIPEIFDAEKVVNEWKERNS